MQKKPILIIQFIIISSLLCSQKSYYGLLYSHCQPDNTIEMSEIHHAELIAFGHQDGYTSESYPKSFWPPIIQLDSITIDSSYVIERKKLKADDIASLRYLLSFTKIENSGKQETYCYLPRHAVIVRNKYNVIIEIIEICFECEAVKFLKRNLDHGVFCLEALEGLKQIFIEYGVDYKIKNKD